MFFYDRKVGWLLSGAALFVTVTSFVLLSSTGWHICNSLFSIQAPLK
jgi:hypothetical protein